MWAAHAVNFAGILILDWQGLWLVFLLPFFPCAGRQTAASLFCLGHLSDQS